MIRKFLDKNVYQVLQKLLIDGDKSGAQQLGSVKAGYGGYGKKEYMTEQIKLNKVFLLKIRHFYTHF